MPIDEILMEAEEKMQKSEEVVQHEFSGVRTGKASPALVDGLMVEAYGSQMRLRDLAGISTPEPRLILIQPYDVSQVGAVEKAIQKSDIGINPAIDGNKIRLILPELSEERRQEYVKLVKKMAEDGRVAVRHVRRDALDRLKKDAKAESIPEDEVKLAEKEIQTLTDKFVGIIDTLVTKKEQEILTV